MANLMKLPLEVSPLPARIYYAKSKLANHLYNFLDDQDLSLAQMSARTGASQEVLNRIFNTSECGCTFDQLIEYLYRADDRAQIMVRRVHIPRRDT